MHPTQRRGFCLSGLLLRSSTSRLISTKRPDVYVSAWVILLSLIIPSVRAQKKEKKDDKVEEKKTRKVVDDKDRHKPFGKTAWAPVDDVYILRHYPRTIYSAADAIDMLKRYQALDFTPENQPLYIDLMLNMKLEKKVISR